MAPPTGTALRILGNSMQRKYAIIQDELGVIAVPGSYDRRTWAASSSDFVTKSEDEAAQVGGW